MGEERQGARSTPPGRRLAVSEAAEVLGISAEAVRSRLKRGTLRSVKEGSSVYVILDADQASPEQSPDTDQTTARSPSDTSALIFAKDETIATLKEQLQAERQAHAEARRIIAGLVERLPPAIEPPASGAAEPPESPETATEQPGRVEPQAQVEGPTERRSWWEFWR